MTDLANKSCVPCRGGISPLKGEAVKKLQEELADGWDVINEHHLEKEYVFKNFKEAVSFTNKVADIAEHEGHHPDIYLAWGKVKLIIWTHKIDGLTESDFILASKVDKVFLSS